MKRYLIYPALAMVLLLWDSGVKRDPGDLIPVELVCIYMEEDRVILETDTENIGTGLGLKEALSDLQASAEGRIFLETADYLIVTEEIDRFIPVLTSYLRPSAEVCMGTGKEKGAAAFLRTHPPGVTINDIRQGTRRVPVLTMTEGRYHLESQSEP